MIIKKVSEVVPQPVNMEGAQDVQVRVVFGPKENAPTFAMRVFELATGGHTPLHEHPFEHEVFILEGPIALMTPDGPRTMNTGDAALIMPDEKHQFINLSARTGARFMCLVPVQYQK